MIRELLVTLARNEVYVSWGSRVIWIGTKYSGEKCLIFKCFEEMLLTAYILKQNGYVIRYEDMVYLEQNVDGTWEKDWRTNG